MTLQLLLGQIRILGGRHLNEAEATALASMWIPHNVTLLYDAVLPEEVSNLVFTEAWCDAGDEEIGAWVDRVLRAAVLVLWSVTARLLDRGLFDMKSRGTSSPLSAPVHGLVANPGVAVAIRAWRA